MKKIINIYIALLAVVLITGCFKEHSEIVPGGEATESIKITNVTSGFYNFLDPEIAQITFTIEAIPNQVELESVEMLVSYNSTADADFRIYETYSTFPVTETITLEEAASFEGLSLNDMTIGDLFRYKFRLNYTDGATRLTPVVVLANVSCPSNLAGVYTAMTTGTSTDPCCPEETTITSEVTISALGNGQYQINDFSAGLYLAWYGPDGGNYGITSQDQSPGRIRDVCNVITFYDTTEPFATQVTGSGTVDDETGDITYTWTNGYDDTGTVTLTKK